MSSRRLPMVPDHPPGYVGLLRTDEADPHRWARAVVGIVLGLAVFLTLTPTIAAAVTGIGWWAAGRPGPYEAYAAAAADFRHPVGVLAANLSIAAVLIPVAVVLVAVWHHSRPGRLASVAGRVRWRWLAVCLGLALPVYGTVLAFTWPDPADGSSPAASAAVFLAVVVATSPVQAAAEEVFFRGYLTQAIGTLTAGPWPAIVVSSLVFALLHGTQNLPLFANRFAFGMLAGGLALVTGGLEAPIAAHAVNNVLAYGAATLTGTVTELRGIAEVTWPAALAGIAGYAAYTVLAGAAGRRLVSRTALQPTRARR